MCRVVGADSSSRLTNAADGSPPRKRQAPARYTSSLASPVCLNERVPCSAISLFSKGRLPPFSDRFCFLKFCCHFNLTQVHCRCRRRRSGQRTQSPKESNEKRKRKRHDITIRSSVDFGSSDIVPACFEHPHAGDLIPAILPQELCRAEPVKAAHQAWIGTGSIQRRTDLDPN
jgi:hypothetical protein